jgi:hypothetical protein
MENECCICLEETKDEINCLHRLCMTCYKSFYFKECPICFKKIEMVWISKRKKLLKPPFLLPKLK